MNEIKSKEDKLMTNGEACPLVMQTKPRVLNLYAGIGGNRKLWTDCDVTAVEMDEETAKVYQDYFPNDKVIIGDAHEYLINNYKDYDFIWASPPCPSHSDIRRMATMEGQYDAIYPEMKLYQEILLLKHYAKKHKWVIENVVPYYDPLIPPTKKLHRHLFWSNFRIGNFDDLTGRTVHRHISGNSEVYGVSLKGTDIKNKRKVLRNMVDPKLGEYLFKLAMEVKMKPKTQQGALFV